MLIMVILSFQVFFICVKEIDVDGSAIAHLSKWTYIVMIKALTFFP